VRPRLLFSAPHDFLPETIARFREEFDVELDEIWLAGELPEQSDAEIWVVNPGQHFVVDDAVLARFPRLRILATPSTGTNHIDLQACEDRGVLVRGLLDDRASLNRISASAEFTFLLVLNGLRRLDTGLEEVAAGNWRRNEERLRGHELEGRQAGLVGFGRIGRRLARYLAAFDVAVRYHDPYVEAEDDFERVASLPELVRVSDVLVVCCSLTGETRGMVNGSLLAGLSQGAVVVNTSRGEVLDEASVAALLEERADLGFAADVLAGEVDGTHLESPLLPLARTGRIVITPHIAGATVESQAKAAEATLGLVREALVQP
jgi:phosphoglycerate dehydrogenase-like enzyme